jgi:hypothetical protein
MLAEPRQAFIRDTLKRGKKYNYRFFSKQENLYTKTILYAQRQVVIPKGDDEDPKERIKQPIYDRLVYNERELYGFVQMLPCTDLRFGKELYLFDERNIFKVCRVSTHMQGFRYG